jgi:hypothetical protein
MMFLICDNFGTFTPESGRIAMTPSSVCIGFVPLAPKVAIDAKTEVDFHTNLMTKPHKRKIRRTFETGLWVQMRSSPSQFQLHAKVNRLQIDNQMYDCIFPVVLAPVPLPKSVAVDSGMKPFAELSIVQLLMKNTQIKQFKYFKLLIQEFHIKVDLGFVNALVDLLQTAQYSETEEQQMFLTDIKLVDEPLYAHVSTQSLQEQKSFYDLLHFSPLKIHVSFSMAAGASTSAETPNFLNVLLQGLGVTLTDLQDVVFKYVCPKRVRFSICFFQIGLFRTRIHFLNAETVDRRSYETLRGPVGQATVRPRARFRCFR